MPLLTPDLPAIALIENEGLVGAAPGTGVPSNATTLLDGAVTELISAANNVRDSWGISITVWDTGAAATASEATLDILVGGATDDVLIESLIVGGAITNMAREYFFPLHISGGVRLAASLASVRTSITSRVSVQLYGGGPPPFKCGHKVTTYGTKINNARGVAITPGASGGAASVTEMTASSSADHFAFIPGFQCSTDTTMNARYFNLGIGVGAATEERIGTWTFGTNGSEQMVGPHPCLPVFREVPSGTRLTILAGNSGANDAAYDGLIYAVS